MAGTGHSGDREGLDVRIPEDLLHFEEIGVAASSQFVVAT
jgi:hypothetical protein